MLAAVWFPVMTVKVILGPLRAMLVGFVTVYGAYHRQLGGAKRNSQELSLY